MRSWHNFDPMHAWTVKEAVAWLPKEFGLAEESLASNQDYYSNRLRTTYIQSYLAFTFNSETVAHFYLEFIWYIFVVLLFLNGIRHLLLPRVRHLLPRSYLRVETFFVKHLYLTSTTGGTKSSEPISLIGATGHLGAATSFQVPLRIHGLVVLCYVVASLALLFTPYRFAKPDIYWFSLGYPFDKYLRGFSDRAGIMSIGLTPLVILLAVRNSPVVWLTGVEYSTLQIYHRWISRITFLGALGHTIGYSVNEAFYDYFYLSFKEAYWNWGWAAIVGGAVLVLASTRWLRQLSYELFLIGHIAGALVWVIGCYYHVWLLDKQYSYLKYIYATIAIWGFERVVRWAMLAWYNLPALRKSNRKLKNSFAAEGYLIGSGSYLRLRLNPVRTWSKSMGGPGSYVFIRSLDGSFWQSHPFTMSWPAGMPSSSTPGSTPSSDSKDGGEDKYSYMPNGLHAFDSTWTNSSTEIELILKSYSGYTKKLAESLADATVLEGQAHPVKTVKLLVEGPYGCPESLNHYDNVLLIAGGSGISASTSHLADMAKGAHASTLNVSRVELVWAVRDIHAVDVLIPYLVRLRPLFPNATSSFLHVSIYYTGEAHAVTSINSDKVPDLPSDGLEEIRKLCAPASSFASFTVKAGRPNLSEHVQMILPANGHRSVVSSCGPEALCDAARLAVRNELGGKNGVLADELAYVEESFTW